MVKGLKEPKLRFSEYRGTGGWKEKEIGEMIEEYSDRDNTALNPAVAVGVYGIRRREDIFSKELSDDISKNKVIYKDTLTIGMGTKEIVIGILKEDTKYSVSPAYNTYNIINMDTNFLELLWAKNNPKLSLLYMITGARQGKSVDRNMLLKHKLYTTNIEEQQKIGSFFSLLDQKINLQSEKIQNLTLYKKGLLQQVMSREIRFKDSEGREYPEWEEVKLGRIAEINPSGGELPNSFIYIDLESVVKGVLIKEQIIDKEEAPSRAQRVAKKNDILYQTVRPYQRNNYYVSSIGDIPLVASTGYALIRGSKCQGFIYQLLHSDGFVNEVLIRCTGTSYPAINSNDLKDIEVSIPISLEEQHKIASLFSTIDKKIEKEQEKLELLQREKKAFMQQMFI